MSGFRASARYLVGQRVGVRCGDALEREALLENVGLEGARLRLAHAPLVGVVVRLRIDTATAWEPLQLDAIVRWSDARESAHHGSRAHGREAGAEEHGRHGETADVDESRIGLEFAPLEPAAALALAEWLGTLRYDDGSRPR